MRYDYKLLRDAGKPMEEREDLTFCAKVTVIAGVFVVLAFWTVGYVFIG